MANDPKSFGIIKSAKNNVPKKGCLVVMKAEWLSQGPNGRFVVTNLSMYTQQVYEFYTKRGNKVFACWWISDAYL